MSAADPLRPPSDGPDRVIRDDLDRIVRTCAEELSGLSGASLLLTGAAGFVGRYLVESVIRFNEVSGGAPCVVTLPTRRPEQLRSRYPVQVAANEVVVAEWGDGHAIDLPGRRWDYVIHGAATTDPAQFSEDPVASFRDTISMAASVADLANASVAKRVVLISSGAVYGDQPADLPEIPETFQGGSDRSVTSPGYAEAKRVSEDLFRQTGLDQRVARVFSLTGPYQDLASRFAVPDLIRQAVETGAIRLTSDGSARRSFCYASDLSVILFRLLLGEPRHDIYNVGCRQGTASIAEVAHAIADIFGGLDVQLGSEARLRVDYVPRLDRLDEVYEPIVGLREGLLRTCHSLYARGLIDRKPAIALGGQGQGQG
jgi:Nucleoside-diphosphate-sugar epimerases